MSFQWVMKSWRDRQRRHEIRVFSAAKVDVISGTPLVTRNEEDSIVSRMREILGDEALEAQQRLVKQRDRFKAAFANAIDVARAAFYRAELPSPG